MFIEYAKGLGSPGSRESVTFAVDLLFLVRVSVGGLTTLYYGPKWKFNSRTLNVMFRALEGRNAHRSRTSHISHSNLTTSTSATGGWV